MVVTIINLIMWVGIGIFNLTRPKIDKVSYGCTWAALILYILIVLSYKMANL
jgi:hypothetical protein